MRLFVAATKSHLCLSHEGRANVATCMCYTSKNQSILFPALLFLSLSFSLLEQQQMQMLGQTIWLLLWLLVYYRKQVKQVQYY